MRKHKKGFTIVELVIVIGVIGILSAILIPTFVNVTDNANKVALKSNLANAYSMYAADAADGYKDDSNGQPTAQALIFYPQAKVVLSKTDAATVTKGYLYTSDGWGTAETDKTATKVANSGEYNGYYIYYFA